MDGSLLAGRSVPLQIAGGRAGAGGARRLLPLPLRLWMRKQPEEFRSRDVDDRSVLARSVGRPVEWDQVSSLRSPELSVGDEQRALDRVPCAPEGRQLDARRDDARIARWPRRDRSAHRDVDGVAVTTDHRRQDRVPGTDSLDLEVDG